MLAECATQLYISRLMLLHIAYKAEKGLDMRQENSIAKVYLAHMVHHVVDTAIQLHGALGYSRDTPLAAWYTHIRSQRLVDGPDEVHRWTVGRNVIKSLPEGRHHGPGGRRRTCSSGARIRTNQGPLSRAAPSSRAKGGGSLRPREPGGTPPRASGSLRRPPPAHRR